VILLSISTWLPAQRNTTLQDKVIQMPNTEPEKMIEEFRGMGYLYLQNGNIIDLWWALGGSPV
jgi:hypothetical protein